MITFSELAARLRPRVCVNCKVRYRVPLLRPVVEDYYFCGRSCDREFSRVWSARHNEVEMPVVSAVEGRADQSPLCRLPEGSLELEGRNRVWSA